MSRMLKALRQLESTQRLNAPTAVLETAEEAVVVEDAAIDQAPEARRPAPIQPINTPPTGDDSFEPAFTSWKELSEPYDSEQGLSFGDFLGDSDAKVQTREVLDGVSPASTPLPRAAVETPIEDPVVTFAETPTTGEGPTTETAVEEIAVAEPLPETQPTIEVANDDPTHEFELSNASLEEEVSAALDLTDVLTSAVADDVVIDDIVIDKVESEEQHTSDGITQDVTPHNQAGEVVEQEELVSLDSGQVDWNAEVRTEATDDLEQAVSEESTVSASIEQEQAEQRLLEAATPSDPVECGGEELSELTPTAEETEELIAATEPVADEVADDLRPTELEDVVESPSVETPMPAIAGFPPTEPEMADEPRGEVAEVPKPDSQTDDDASESDTSAQLDEQVEATSISSSDAEAPVSSNDLDWSNLFPGGELDGELLDAAPSDVIKPSDVLGQDADPLVGSLGSFDVDALVAQAAETSVATEEPVSTGDDPSAQTDPSELNVVATETNDSTSDAEQATADGATITLPIDAENRAELSPAETAALADLTDDEALKQYKALGKRIVDDLGKATHRSAVLVGAEHQPHVTETTLRTAIALGLGQKQQVLMIDASLNDKHLTAGLNLTVESGLSEVLKGRVPWQQAVRATNTPGVCVLPAGRLPPPKFEAGDDSLTQLLKELTSQWDLVLLDGGNCQEPAAKSVMTAARNVYLLVRLGETEAEAAAAAVETIAVSGATNRGVVATNVSSS